LNKVLIDASDELIEKVLGVAIIVHRELGPGLLESVYEKALIIELANFGISARCQVPVAVVYKGHDLGVGLIADIIVEEQLLLELKAVETLNDVHLAQTMTYLKLLRLKRGFLLNFNTKQLKDGIKRVSI
jgi:GxxExxY protein